MAKRPEEERTHYINTVCSACMTMEGRHVGGLGKETHPQKMGEKFPRGFGKFVFSVRMLRTKKSPNILGHLCKGKRQIISCIQKQ